MTTYNVHLYREMRLTYEGVEAASHEEAARIASGLASGEADQTDDCDGENFGALVDVAGDNQHEQSRMIDFEAERVRKAAPQLLEALESIIAQIESLEGESSCIDEDILNSEEMAACRAAIAKAKGGAQ